MQVQAAKIVFGLPVGRTNRVWATCRPNKLCLAYLLAEQIVFGLPIGRTNCVLPSCWPNKLCLVFLLAEQIVFGRINFANDSRF